MNITFCKPSLNLCRPWRGVPIPRPVFPMSGELNIFAAMEASLFHVLSSPCLAGLVAMSSKK